MGKRNEIIIVSNLVYKTLLRWAHEIVRPINLGETHWLDVHKFYDGCVLCESMKVILDN